jgi:tRNA (mo5U34)-methyltransferase
MLDSSPQHALADRVASVSWYHSLLLPGGLITPGSFDTLDELTRVPFPASLENQRCLDVATADGFWAFEMERRGAAEVVAIDLRPERMDWPGNAASKAQLADTRTSPLPRSFDIAHEAFESRVRWRELSAYELTPEVIGEFDFIFIGSLLAHLRDPVAALAAIGGVLRGELLSVDAISAPLTLLHPRRPLACFEAPGWPLWWVPNLQAYRQLFGAARLEIVASGRPFFLKRGPAYCAAYDTGTTTGHHPFHQRLKQAAGARLGNLHAWVCATATYSS